MRKYCASLHIMCGKQDNLKLENIHLLKKVSKAMFTSTTAVFYKLDETLRHILLSVAAIVKTIEWKIDT